MSSSEIFLNNTNKNILKFLSDGEYHTGETLGEYLGISRAAVWKAIQHLLELKIPIKSCRRLGYCLPDKLDLLDIDLIKNHIHSNYSSYVKNIYVFDIIDSTNTWLNRYNSENPQKFPAWCTAEMQTQGKGRFQRQWYSPFANNIYLSLLWHFVSDPQELSGLTLAAGVAAIEALNEFVAPGLLQLKWPNDIYYQNKKLGGILSELKAVNYDSSTVILGIGINVYMDEETDAFIDCPWSSLKNILPKSVKFSRNILLAALMNHLIRAFVLFQQQGLKPFIEKYKALDLSFNKEVTIILPKNQEVLLGISRGVNEQGAFCLELPTGEIKQFITGEVSLKLSDN